MKRLLRLFCLIMALSVPVLIDAGQTLIVQVKTGQIRATPSFLGQIVATVPYHAKVTLLVQEGEWMQVTLPSGESGWIPASSVKTKQLSLSAGSEDAHAGASNDELALAGKGFNSDVEAQFKNKNRIANFAAVDSMEKIVITPQESAEFLKNGDINPKH